MKGEQPHRITRDVYVEVNKIVKRNIPCVEVRLSLDSRRLVFTSGERRQLYYHMETETIPAKRILNIISWSSSLWSCSASRQNSKKNGSNSKWSNRSHHFYRNWTNICKGIKIFTNRKWNLTNLFLSLNVS